MSKKILVTKPFLPPLEEFIPFLHEIWESHIITNCGPMHEKLEEKLAEYLGVSNLVLVSNGTTALMLALNALELSGEIITTPYTFAATANSIIWANCVPVFVDVDIDTCNINPNKIASAITPKTCAILGVHCYGIPCDVNELKKIADENGIKCIYDAAHCFGVEDGSGSILNYGDASTLSFHATKVFHTIEGGAIVCSDEKLAQRLRNMRNFGLCGEMRLDGVGFNSKMSEINSAMGLLQLKHLNECLQKRKEISKIYEKYLGNLENIKIITNNAHLKHNYSYYPIRVNKNSHKSRDDILQKLEANGIFARKYFFPIIPKFSNPEFQHELSKFPNAETLSNEVICLPIYPNLSPSECMRVAKVVVDVV